MDKKNLSIIRQLFAQCVFNHKIHEKATDRLWKFINWIKWWNIIFLWLDLAFLIMWIKNNNQVLINLSVWLTIAEILFLFIQKEFPIEEMIKSHKNIAIQYLWLRNEYENLIVDIMNNKIKSDIICEKRDLLQKQYNIICALSPNTTREDYKNTQMALLWTSKSDEEFTRSDKEINRFLPKNLHI